MPPSPHEKQLIWVGGSKRDLMTLPQEVVRFFGHALDYAQRGETHAASKPLAGFGGAGVLEIVENDTGGTYRAIYTVRFEGAVYVLHCFQKKSKTGVATPRADLQLVRERLKVAEAHAKAAGDVPE